MYITYMKKSILVLAMLIQYLMLTAQLSFPNIDCLRDHLEGRWELYKHYWGIQGQSDYYPTADDNYFFEFSKYAPDTFKMVCKKFHNGLVTKTDTIRISYKKYTLCCWEIVNVPGMIGSQRMAAFLSEQYQTNDSLCLFSLGLMPAIYGFQERILYRPKNQRKTQMQLAYFQTQFQIICSTLRLKVAKYQNLI